MNQKNFDIEAYLDDRGVRYATSGPNVGSGDIGLDPCLWCGARNNHLGIKLSNKRVYCWVCGGHSIYELVGIIDNCSGSKAAHIIREFYASKDFAPAFKDYDKKIEYPKEAVDLDMYWQHIHYLHERNFDPDAIGLKYKLKAVGPFGKYKWRIIIPVIMNERIGGFTSRDVTDQQTLRYKNQPQGQSPIPQERWIYNIDTIKDSAILVEGPTDVWRLGKGAISLLGIQPTHEQILQLSQIKNLFIIFDNEPKAQERANQLSGNLAGITDHVEVVTVDKEGDPAEWTPEEAWEVKNELGL